MLGYHCKIAIGSYLETIPFFSLFQMTWLTVTGWMPEASTCLPGGLL